MFSSRAMFAVALLTLTTPALAQQQAPSDPAYLQQAILALQAQRNEAMDRSAAIAANVQMLAAENEKLKARVKELEAKTAPAAPN